MKEKPVKLLLAITKSNWGGAQRYVYDIARHFNTDSTFEVSVMTGGNGDLVKKLKEEKIRVIPIPYLKRDVNIIDDLRSTWWLYKTIHHEKPDILHLNSSKIGLFGGIIGRFCGVKKIIFTAHAWPFNESRPKYQRFIFKLLGMMTVFVAHTTIAVSQSVINSLRAPRFISKKMNRIYTGIETPKLYEAGLFFEKFGIQKNEGVHLVSIGELHMSKGYDRTLIALAKCKHLPWTYHIMGTGEKREYLEMLIEQLGLQGRVILHGFVENASLYLNSFDVFLFPSRTEALGYVAIEALFTKLPIIASNAGGIPEVLFDDPYTKIIDCNDEKVFKQTLLSFIKKPPTVDETNRPGRMRFLPRFMFTATKKIYINGK
jgi:glycosyltransferase involved in cell wall biosynthesis